MSKCDGEKNEGERWDRATKRETYLRTVNRSLGYSGLPRDNA